MDFNFSITDSPVVSIGMALRTVYLLEADHSYDVRKKESENKDFIALRTYSGSGKVSIEGFDEMTVLPGTVLFFEHRLVRRYFCEANKWEFYWFEFYTNEPIFPLNRVLQIENIDNELQDSKSCMELLRKDNIYSNAIASATLNVLIYKWITSLYIKTAKNSHESGIEKVIEYMKIKLPEIISLKEMANMVELSERRFRDIFRKVTGYQPKRYYDILRIKTADQLLKNSNYSIDEISIKLGYSSQFHFSKAFKKAHGVSPMKFRQF